MAPPATEERLMGSAFLITTLDRPEELLRCVATIMNQSILPEEIVVVDASKSSIEDRVREIVDPSQVELVYVLAPRGRTRQLNLGIRESSRDPLFFVDDDAELDPSFHAAMLEAFRWGGPSVGGVQAVMENNNPRPLPERAAKAIFLLSRRTKDKPGRMLPSGYHTIPVKPSKPLQSEVIWLGATGYRRSVLEEFHFDESPDGPVRREDIDFSYRVSRRYKLLITPEARFHHCKAPNARLGAREGRRSQLVNDYLVFRKNLPVAPLQNASFAWAMLGTLGLELLKMALTGKSQPLMGTLDAVAKIARMERCRVLSRRQRRRDGYQSA